MRLLRALALLIAATLASIGLGAASPPVANAAPNIDNIFSVGNWKHNTKNIRMCGVKKKKDVCENVKPGKRSGDYRKIAGLKIKKVYIPSGCYATWTKSVSASVHKKRMKGGQWHAVSNARATYLHSTLYLWENKGERWNWCNTLATV